LDLAKEREDRLEFQYEGTKVPSSTIQITNVQKEKRENTLCIIINTDNPIWRKKQNKKT